MTKDCDMRAATNAATLSTTVYKTSTRCNASLMICIDINPSFNSICQNVTVNGLQLSDVWRRYQPYLHL